MVYTLQDLITEFHNIQKDVPTYRLGQHFINEFIKDSSTPETWSITPWYKKVFICIKGVNLLAKRPKEYTSMFKDKLNELTSHYKGTYFINNIAKTTYNYDYSINTSVESIVEFADSGKDCYLDAGCVKVINLLKNNYYKLDEGK